MSEQLWDLPPGYQTDVLIIGAGIAGCIAAIALADRFRVVLIDKLGEPADRIGESLAPAGKRILTKLNLWEGLQRDSHPLLYISCPGMQSCWGQENPQIEDHMFNPDGFVLNLNRKGFEMFLRNSARERGIHSFWPAEYYSSTYDRSGWKVTLRSQDHKGQIRRHHIEARCIIDATGRQSRFARSQGIRRIQYDKLVTYWATRSDLSENKMSTVSATESGWWYSAVVPGNKRVFAYQTDPDLIDGRLGTQNDHFRSLLSHNKDINRIIESSDDPLEFQGVVSSNSTRLRKIIGQQWVALGDAGMSFDPLSSQGMFHAMASAMQFSDLLDNYDPSGLILPSVWTSLESHFTEQMDQVWDSYRHHHRLFYRAENRWVGEVFWARRLGL